jgi:hypothetical protein
MHIRIAAAAVAGAVLLIGASRSHSPRLAVNPTRSVVAVGPQRVWVGPPLRATTSKADNVLVRVAPPSLLRVSVADGWQDHRSLGLVLLIVGLAGIVLVAGSWSARVAFNR